MFSFFTPVICLDEEFVRIAGCFPTRSPTLDTTRQSFILYFRFILYYPEYTYPSFYPGYYLTIFHSLLQIQINTILNINPSTLDTTRQSFILYFRFILILSLISILLPWILLDNLSFFTSGSY